MVDGVILDSESGGDQFYSGGTISLYEDDSTPADYANPATFSDGTALLSGTFTVLNRSDAAVVGAGQRLRRLDRWEPDRRSGSGGSHGLGLLRVRASAAEAMAGYDENWDGKVEPREPVVSTDSKSFGGLKTTW